MAIHKCLSGCGQDATYNLKENGNQSYIHWNYCSSCWMKLTPEERGILTGKTPKKLVEIEIRERILPAIPKSVRILELIWKTLVSIILFILSVAVCLMVKKLKL